jgi:hypothetical protein
MSGYMRYAMERSLGGTGGGKSFGKTGGAVTSHTYHHYYRIDRFARKWVQSEFSSCIRTDPAQRAFHRITRWNALWVSGRDQCGYKRRIHFGPTCARIGQFGSSGGRCGWFPAYIRNTLKLCVQCELCENGVETIEGRDRGRKVWVDCASRYLRLKLGSSTYYV